MLTWVWTALAASWPVLDEILAISARYLSLKSYGIWWRCRHLLSINHSINNLDLYTIKNFQQGTGRVVSSIWYLNVCV